METLDLINTINQLQNTFYDKPYFYGDFQILYLLDPFW